MPDEDKTLIAVPSGTLSIGTATDSKLLQSFVSESLAAARVHSGEAQGCTVLFGDWDDEFIDHFEAELRSLTDAPGITIRRCGEVVELRAAIQNATFDLVVVTLNNVFGVGDSPDQRVRGLLMVVEELKRSSDTPLIAISGHYDSDDLPERARAAGADIFRDRTDTHDLAHLAVLYLSRAYPAFTWKTAAEK
jgi:hypothetical protein